MLKTVIRYVAAMAFICFLALNLFAGYFGISSVFLTFTVFLLLLWGLWKVLGASIKNHASLKNARLLLVSLMLSLLGGELTLRYITKTNLSYSELNGHLFYNSMYRRSELKAFADFMSPGYSKEMTVVNRPHATKTLATTEFNYTHHYNSLGLRGDEPTADSSKKTIVILGDSFVEGQGAPDDSTWVRLLENKLNSRQVFSKQVQCINGGLAGSDVFFEFKVLEKYLLGMKPDHVILTINTSDIVDIIVRGGNERFGEGGRLYYQKPPWWEYIYQFSLITRAMVHSVGEYDWMLLSPEQKVTETESAMRKLKDCILNDYVALSKSEGFKLTVVLNPRLGELEQNDFPFTELGNNPDLTREVQVINLHSEFVEWKKTTNAEYNSIFWPIDLHHNAAGYNLFAQIMSDPRYY